MNLIKVFKALGDENRLRIVNLLIQEELCVCELETILDLSQSNVSRHLNKLKESNIVGSNKKAQWVHYYISHMFKINELFYGAICKELQSNEQCIKDTEKLKLYLNSNYTCEDIREDKSKVIQYLEEK